MNLIRVADAVAGTLRRLQKFHGHLCRPGDEDVKNAIMDSLVKGSKELVNQAGRRLSSVNITTILTDGTTSMYAEA